LLVKNDNRPRIQIEVGMGNSKINARVFIVNSLSAMKNEMMHPYNLFSPFKKGSLRQFSIDEISPFGFI
jgi:hypothetical protein